MRVYAELGNSKYMMEDSETPRVLRITRTNSDGTKEFFIPSDLVAEFVNVKLGSALGSLLKKVMETA